MTTVKLSIPYGDGELPFELPEENLLAVVRPGCEQVLLGQLEGQLPIAVGDGELHRRHVSLAVSRSARPSL